jgi:hypothetical protein
MCARDVCLHLLMLHNCFYKRKNSQQAQRLVGGGYIFARRLIIVDKS